MVYWVEIPTPVLRNARKRQGLSYETMGREINVSGKTYERYEKAGRVPRQLVARVAEVLDLEIESPARARVTVAPPMEGTATELAEVKRSVARIERMLHELLDPLRDAPGSA